MIEVSNPDSGDGKISNGAREGLEGIEGVAVGAVR